MENSLFETERLIIRKLILDDVEFLFKYSQEEITKKELPDEVFESTIEIKEAFEYFMSNYDTKYPLVYGIVLKTKNIVVGHISLSTIDKGIEIGYSIATDYQNKGYATEVINPFVKWAKGELHIERVYGIVKKENISSWKVLEKNGFSLEGEGIYKNYFNGNHFVKIYVNSSVSKIS